MVNQSQAQVVALRARETLGDPAAWFHPGGYPDGLALCVLDSIWSLGVRYERHVVPVLEKYGEARKKSGADPARDGLRDLRSAIAVAGGPGAFADVLGNRQRAWSRSSAPLKAEAVDLAAQRLLALGIDSAADLREHVSEDQKVVHREWRTVPGQKSSDIGWRYRCCSPVSTG